MKLQISLLLTWCLLAGAAAPARADGKSKLAQEAAECVIQRFGRKAAQEGAEVLARKIETYAARHGDDFFHAVRQVGPRAFPLVEEAGEHGARAARVLAQHGEHGARWVVSRPQGMALVVQHGDDCARVLCRHPGVAEPVVERFGQPAVRALQGVSPQNGRRLAMLAESGDLAKIGRTPELLGVVEKHGDAALDFIWRNKGALAVGTTLTAFLANPESFLNAAVKPVAEVPATVAKEVGRGTNWTAVFVAAILAAILLIGARAWHKHRVAAAAKRLAMSSPVALAPPPMQPAPVDAAIPQSASAGR